MIGIISYAEAIELLMLIIRNSREIVLNDKMQYMTLQLWIDKGYITDYHKIKEGKK